jgi:hypothetical protein
VCVCVCVCVSVCLCVCVCVIGGCDSKNCCCSGGDCGEGVRCVWSAGLVDALSCSSLDSVRVFSVREAIEAYKRVRMACTSSSK